MIAQLNGPYLDSLQRVLANASRPAAPAANYEIRPPWIDPPDGAVPFDFAGVLATPAKDGLFHSILSQRVPNGFSGVVRKLSHNYTGGGFVPGSGDLVWRISIDGAAVKNYEALAVEFGSTTVPRECWGIRLRAGQTITYEVAHAVASGLAVAGTSVISFLSGYFWPDAC